MITLGLGLFGVLWAITKLANAPLDASTVGFLAGGVALIGAFVAIEARVAAPMLPLRIFKVPTMAASLCASLFQGLASYAVLFLVLMYLQGAARPLPDPRVAAAGPRLPGLGRRRPLRWPAGGPARPGTARHARARPAGGRADLLRAADDLHPALAHRCHQPSQRRRDQPVLHGAQAAAFTTGLHAAFYESVAFMVIAAVLSALRGTPGKGGVTASRS
jgi:hypothetical protein